MPVFINQHDALTIMASVEGQDWKRRQHQFGSTSFQAFFDAWRKTDQALTGEQRARPDIMAMGISTDDGNGAIYGDGGWSRYTVRVSGEILFIERQSPSEEITELAKQAGFNLF